ncbi:SUMO-specific isopeptidase uspl1 [Saguinus oedipus]|uniref:SUMO-specific isopeptidase uspl1 n=1 Tax=Saguinus oedipus TaxID=9490 RepID=A0ABQ9VTF7_SAGOE|nr:SUMO-specific isopeptidase uspl1 [Saguinus oedipus]
MDSSKIGNGLPVIGPGADIGVSSLHMNYDSAKVPSDGYCPACIKKGKLKALKTYRISFQESIFLCEDLQDHKNREIGPVVGAQVIQRKVSEDTCKECEWKPLRFDLMKSLKFSQLDLKPSKDCIYPLGFKSLNNLISPDSEECHTPHKPQKRRNLESSYKDSLLLANSKKTRNYIITDNEQILNSKCNGEVYDETSSNLPDSSDQQNPIRTTDSLEPNEILEADSVDVATAKDPATGDVSGTGGPSLQSEGCTSKLEMPLERKCTSFPQTLCVQWKNAYALCWLDCILSALVHLEELKNTVTGLCSKKECVFWRLFTKYNRANRLLYTSQLSDIKDGDCKKLTSEIFAEIETCLNEVRDEIFVRLQPQLRCTLGSNTYCLPCGPAKVTVPDHVPGNCSSRLRGKLDHGSEALSRVGEGDMESPVFAFPLLLKLEPHVEKLFLSSFSWDFKCSQCGHQYQNRCMKSLITFTNVIPEWHPLNAAHFGPCNNCNSKSQIRKMILEKVSPIFMLHFVEGLPQNDLQHYAFHFEGCLYQITSVIQYQANNHFITWILDDDGSWLECDDLKGPCSERHKKFEVPASEIHIVIWERKTSQVTDKEAACLPLRKTNDQHAVGNEKSVSSMTCSVGDAASAETASVTHPKDTSVAQHTLSQDSAVTHGDHFLSGSKGLVDNILPLILEETTQKTASVSQLNSEAFLLENKLAAENRGILKTSTLQSQESLMASSVSAPLKEKLIQDQFVSISFPSQVVNTSMQSVQLNTEGTVNTNFVNNTHATGLIQGVKSVEIERDAQLKQFLTPKTEQLKPEHVTSQVSNLKRKEITADSLTTSKSLQHQSLKENQKKPFVGSWVKGLISRGASFMPLCVSAHNRNMIIDLQPSVKGVNNFGGFKTKGINQKASHVAKKARRSETKPPPISKPPPVPPLSDGTAAPLHAHAAPEVLEKSGSTSCSAQLNHSSHGNGVSSSNHEDLVEGQIHKLRLKLRKKLKAQKKKLAALMSSPHSGTAPSENLEQVPQGGSPNDCESIEDLLNELPYEIDTASESACTTVPGVSLYGSQTHEEILAELLSPATAVSAELSENGEGDFRYLGMGDSGIPSPAPSELNVSQNTHLRQDHNYCSPTKKNPCEVQPDSLTNNASVRTLNLESPMKNGIFDEFFPPSSLNALASDALDLPHFDEYLFEY